MSRENSNKLAFSISENTKNFHKGSIGLLFPQERVTRASTKMVLTDAQIALNKFIQVSDRLSEFESKINTPSAGFHSMFILNIRREEARDVWDRQGVGSLRAIQRYRCPKHLQPILQNGE